MLCTEHLGGSQIDPASSGALQIPGPINGSKDLLPILNAKLYEKSGFFDIQPAYDGEFGLLDCGLRDHDASSHTIGVHRSVNQPCVVYFMI